MEVPKQVRGKQSDNSAHVDLAGVPEAIDHFKTVLQRFMDVNGWKKITGGIGAEFLLHDQSGKALDRSVSKDDYIRINIPGPGLSAGSGYDWVKVLDITENINHLAENEREEIMMTVRPSDNPQTPGGETAHFFEDSATSTFIARREASRIVVEVHGRNEKANTELSENLDKLRNKLVATGATTLFSDIQWRKLAEALVKQPD